MPDQAIQQFLDDLAYKSESQQQLICQLRQHILGLAAGLSEEIKYGGILFGAPQHFCGLFVYTGHITLEFSEGANLPDPERRLLGKGKFRRHLKWTQQDSVDYTQLDFYLHAALKQAQARPA